MPAIRVMLDSMVYDKAATDQAFRDLIAKRQTEGRIQVFTTHIQEGQLSKIPEHRDIGQRDSVTAEGVPTSVFALGISALGGARLGTDEANAAYESLRSGPNHLPDALIGATAITDMDVLVTDDGRFRNRVKRLASSIRAISTVEFRTMLDSIR